MLYFSIKRMIDIVGAVCLLILFGPLMFIAAISIKLQDSGPIFADTPKRIGKNGRLFKMYKFRSMIQNAHQYLLDNPDLYEEYKRNNYKLKNDPRITKIGKVIRKTSIDEMPQFVNVLRGEMSLVGPRAYYDFELEEQQRKYPYTKKYVQSLLQVKPGITGPWQISGRSEIDFDKRVEMDAFYAQRRSILYDFIILIKTPYAVIKGKGAV